MRASAKVLLLLSLSLTAICSVRTDTHVAKTPLTPGHHHDPTRNRRDDLGGDLGGVASGDLEGSASSLGPTHVEIGKAYPVYDQGYGGGGGGYGGGGGGYGHYPEQGHSGPNSGYTHVVQIDNYDGYGGDDGGSSKHHYGDPRYGFFRVNDGKGRRRDRDKGRGRGRGRGRGKGNDDVRVVYVDDHKGGYSDHDDDDYGGSYGHVDSHYHHKKRHIGPEDIIKWAYVGNFKQG